jgi:hypothetical protein
MKNRLVSSFILFTLALLAGCAKSSPEAASESESRPEKVYTEVELRKLIVPGMQKAEVINIFGNSSSEIQVATNLAMIVYTFPSEVMSGKEALHLTGFTINMRDGKVVDWSPMMGESHEQFRRPEDSEAQFSYGEHTFELYSVSDMLTNAVASFESGSSVTEDALKVSADFVFNAQVFAADLASGASSNKPIRLVIHDQDIPKLSRFTEGNVGKQVVIATQNKIIAAPRISMPITSSQFQLDVKDVGWLRKK